MSTSFDLGLVKSFGQIAAPAGIAIGAFLYVARDVIAKNIFPTLTKERSYHVILALAFMAWTIALTGIGAWAYVSSHAQVIAEVKPDTETSPAINALQASIQDIEQVKKSAKQDLSYMKKRVFCDSVRMRLLISHRPDVKTPINVNSIAVKNEAITALLAQDKSACAIDTLSSKPYGIVNVDTFVVTLTDREEKAKLIKNASSATEVAIENILQSATGSRAITLKQGEEPIAFDVLLESKGNLPRKVWFEINYDQDGERKQSTAPFLIWR